MQNFPLSFWLLQNLTKNWHFGHIHQLTVRIYKGRHIWKIRVKLFVHRYYAEYFGKKVFAVESKL